MVKTYFYQEANGRCPVIVFLRRQTAKAKAKARTMIKLLRERGHDLDRPYAAYLRDDIYELRWRFEKRHFRILYFFHERNAVVLTNALIKKSGPVPEENIDRAVRRKQIYEKDPEKHTYWGES